MFKSKREKLRIPLIDYKWKGYTYRVVTNGERFKAEYRYPIDSEYSKYRGWRWDFREHDLGPLPIGNRPPDWSYEDPNIEGNSAREVILELRKRYGENSKIKPREWVPI